ncbi:hypothetical protein BpHYR1_037799 [Brachionus plicatilis]|uniref:Uncharacterized protein n=1 Tax=Brachionus plicatilis TaxID=10195 RepID=A0A3M7PAA1_BRAPC|nr:hypothetical protein BpHYR1_037799 [Brachionus plicatilis]
MTLTELKKKKNLFVCYFPSFLRNFGYHRCPPKAIQTTIENVIDDNLVTAKDGTQWKKLKDGESTLTPCEIRLYSLRRRVKKTPWNIGLKDPNLLNFLKLFLMLSSKFPLKMRIFIKKI